MPYADLSDRERDRRLDNVTDLFTVDLLVRYVTWKLESGRGAAATAPASPSPIGRRSIARNREIPELVKLFRLHSTIRGWRTQ